MNNYCIHEVFERLALTFGTLSVLGHSIVDGCVGGGVVVVIGVVGEIKYT